MGLPITKSILNIQRQDGNMKEPSEELLLAYGKVHYWYNQVRTGMFEKKNDLPEYVNAQKKWKESRIALEKLQRVEGDKHYDHR